MVKYDKRGLYIPFIDNNSILLLLLVYCYQLCLVIWLFRKKNANIDKNENNRGAIYHKFVEVLESIFKAFVLPTKI